MGDFINLKGFEGSESYEKINRVFNKVLKKIPIDDKVALSKKNVVVLLGEKITSYCIPIYLSQRSNNIYDSIEVNIVALSSGIIDESISNSVYTIAHELAHAYLGHKQYVPSLSVAKNHEMEADQQVIKWGFEKELRANPDNYLFGNGIENTFST